MDSAFKIAFTVPESHSEKLMDAIDKVMMPFFPGYERTYCITKVTGTWRPLKGSHPFNGTIGKIEVSDELKIEFIVCNEDLKNVLRTIKDLHPYEEPVVDVIPCLNWKSIL